MSGIETFNEWFVHLVDVARRHDWTLNEADKDSYIEYYDHGYTPKEALLEEMSYAL